MNSILFLEIGPTGSRKSLGAVKRTKYWAVWSARRGTAEVASLSTSLAFLLGTRKSQPARDSC